MSSQSVDIEGEFQKICQAGAHVCCAFTCFSQMEKDWMSSAQSWNRIRPVIVSEGVFEAVLNMQLGKQVDVPTYMQLLISCMLDFNTEWSKTRLEVLLKLIDTQTEIDEALVNSKIIKALVALGCKRHKFDYYHIFSNCKKVLAHIFKKNPQWLQANAIRSRSKFRRMRFTEKDIEKYF